MKTIKPKPPLTMEQMLQARLKERVLQAVEEAGSVSRATRSLRMTEEEINEIIKGPSHGVSIS
ncbi:MAG: hypothetical protein Q7T13_01630 [Polaromonas sp.]|nr:hypothetical protein [Polaromonas sp.]